LALLRYFFRQGLEETINTVAKGAAKGGAGGVAVGDDNTKTYAPGSAEANSFFLDTLKELKKGFLVKKSPDQWPAVREQMHKVAHKLLQERREDVLALTAFEGKDDL
jgi:hypothetical protein